MNHKILILSGDGIGPEIMAEAEKVLSVLAEDFGLRVETERGLVGGAALDATGRPLPVETLALARSADAVLFGAIGGPKWDAAPRELRPERGLLGLRSGMGVFANLRPVQVFPELVSASALKTDVVTGLDILIVRELTGGIYFGRPRALDRGAQEGAPGPIGGPFEPHRARRRIARSATGSDRSGDPIDLIPADRSESRDDRWPAH